MALKKIIYYRTDGTILVLEGKGAEEYEKQMHEASQFCQNHGLEFKTLPWRDITTDN